MNTLLPDPSDEPPWWTEDLEAIDILIEDRGDRLQGSHSGNVPLEGARSVLLGLGRKKFRKAPTKKQLERLESMTDPAQLEELGQRLYDVASWADLLAGL